MNSHFPPRRWDIFCQVIDQCMSIDIRLKTTQCKSFLYVKRIVSILIQLNMERIRQLIAVFCKDLQDFISHPVQRQIFLPGTVISSIILKRKRIR